MSNIFQADKTYDPSEILTLLAFLIEIIDFDFDNEDLDENNPIIIEQKNSSQYDEDEFAEDESLENENFHRPNSNSKSILSRRETVLENRPPISDERTSRRNIFRTRPGTKHFILAQVNTTMHVLKDLWVHPNFEYILCYTKNEVLRQKNNEFFIINQELDALFGLCLLRGVFKGRNVISAPTVPKP